MASNRFKSAWMRATFATACTLTFVRGAAAETLGVPGDFATIQACIDAAISGLDECVVEPGTYNECVNFSGKAITLRSSEGPDITIIDGTGLGCSVVRCVNGEGLDTVLEGFTVRGGTGDTTYPLPGIAQGGGSLNVNSSPSIGHCIFTDNHVTPRGSDGGGMSNYDGSRKLSHP